MTTAGRVASAWLGTFATNGVNLAIGMATGILVARLLLPEGRGGLAAILFWPDLFWSIGLLGLRDATSYQISRADPQDQPRVTTTALCLALTLAAVIGSATAVLMPRLLGPERAAYWSLAQIFALTYIPLLAVVSTMLAIDQGRLLFRQYNLLRTLSSLVYLAGLIGLWAAGLISVFAVVVAAWLSTLVAAIAHTIIKARALRARPSLDEGRRLLSLNLQFHSTNLAFLLGTHLDRLALMLFWDDVAIGLYVVALRWASAGMNAVTLSFQNVMFAHVAAEGDPGRQRSLLVRGLRYACLLLVASTAGLLVTTPWFLPLLFGNEFAAAVPLGLVLLGASLPHALRQIIIRSLRGLGKARPGTVAEVVGILVFLACVWPLIRAFGLLGVGTSLLFANLASLGYLVHYLSRHLGLGPSEWWGVDMRTSREVAALGLEQLRSIWDRHVRSRRSAESPGGPLRD